MGRFLSPDPIWYPFCHNLYNYANGDPINYTDPSGRYFSPAYQTLPSSLINTLKNPRIQGGMRAFGGIGEVTTGSMLAAGTSGVGAIPGWLLITHGIDQFCAGASQMITGIPKNTATVQLLQKASMSHRHAEIASDCVSI